MSAFDKPLLAKFSRRANTGLWFLAIAASIFFAPAINPFQNVLAAIDATMPDTIPDEVIADWKDQDSVTGDSSWAWDITYTNATTKIIGTLPAEYVEQYDAEKAGLSEEKLYLLACHYRRVARMKRHDADLENIMFARHYNFGGICVGYHDNTEVSSTDWPSEGGKGALCVLNMKNYYSEFKEILTKKDAVVRDPCISFDGKKVLFAISGTKVGTGYKIYEMEIADPTEIRQLTTNPEGLPAVADFEPCYLPGGDIMFTSTRNFAMSGKGFKATTNMFLMDGQGRYMRQVGFDQAHTFYPVISDEGTVLYSRLEFNDRMITGSFGLFSMHPDGTHQTEYFGNQTSWPMTMIQGRPIPGSNKVIAVAGGYHGPYAGELMIIDHSKGYNGAQSITMIAPKRETKMVSTKTDVAMGGIYFLFQTPCPLDENDFLVSWRKAESETIYKLYFMDVDGNRELLAWADQSLSQPVLIKPRETPPLLTRQADYSDSIGTFTMQDVYYGEGMKGVERGAAKTLRVVKLTYRVAGLQGNFGQNMGSAPSGVYAPAITCPVSAYGGSWEAKEVLGEAKIYPDGSAAFTVPARTPVYFQVLDSMGYCIATMRSWTTLMPGEIFACWGCHENKLESPPACTPQASLPQKLDTPLGVENKPFDYITLVQPIFEEKCVNCHTSDHESGFDLSGTLVTSASRSWATSYNSLLRGISSKSSNKAINICTIFSIPEQQPPRSFGSSLSGIMLTGGMSGSHHDVQVNETERKIVACWIDLCAPSAGTYSSHLTNSAGYDKLMDKRRKWAAIEKENINALLAEQTKIVPNDHNRVNYSRTITEQLKIGYLPKQHTLVLYDPGQGTFMIVDLRGTVISRLKLSDRPMNSTISISLPACLSSGVYVARFEGVKGIRQTKISITK